MLDHVVHFPENCHVTRTLCPTLAILQGTTNQTLTPTGEDMEKRARNLAAKFVDTATSDMFLLKHLLANASWTELRFCLLTLSMAPLHPRRVSIAMWKWLCRCPDAIGPFHDSSSDENFFTTTMTPVCVPKTIMPTQYGHPPSPHIPNT